jgi:ankyrin repeat protein
VAEFLLIKGAEVNACDGSLLTPLGSAIKSKQNELANLLRKHGGKTGEELKAAGN